MTETPNIYERAFAKTDKTDAILVVDGKKLHVNKALLSHHSDYFNTLFNSNFKEKSMKEIPIDDVIFEDFATVLSLIHNTPIVPIAENAEKLLELSDRFLLPSAKRHLELFIITTSLNAIKKLELADNFHLDLLLKHALSLFSTVHSIAQLGANSKFSDKTKARLFERQFELLPKPHIPPYMAVPNTLPPNLLYYARHDQ